MEDGLDLGHRDAATLLLVEDTEALLGLVLTPVPRDVSVGDNVLHKWEIHTVTFLKLVIALGEVCVDLALRQAMEAEVVQDVSEVVDRDETALLLVIELEGLRQVKQHIAG